MENNYNGLEIAVIGISGKFSHSKDIKIFWDNLKNGKELIYFFSENELKEVGISEELIKNPNYIKAGGFLEDSEYFDAAFFGFTPDDAEIMDPQMRLFYEHSWKALEDAACIPKKFKGLIGVYAGASSNFNWEAMNLIKGKLSWDNSTIIDKDNLATNIAYKLNLKGPALTVSTGCSTSLVAINNACFGILTGQCDIAIAGGVTIRSGKSGYMYQEGMIYSPDGHNRTFDEKAGGTVGGSGIGVVVLKRLQEALDDGDHIYAVVKGIAINNDGNRKIGFTAPSIEGQVDVIRAALQMAEVEPESISYVECHGTATNLGDPVEVESLRLAFNTNKRNYCAIGSVKSNLGHLDAAAGVVGFIKTVLCLKNRMLIPSLYFENPNPKIDFRNSSFYVNTETKEWKNDKYPLRAGVTSLGVGGTNAHAVLEESPKVESSIICREYKLLLLSGKTESALENNINNFKKFIINNVNVNLADVAYTLQIGREHFMHRRMFVCKNIEAGIDNIVKTKSNVNKNTKKNTVFMFSGQGSQYVNMGRGLYEKETYFRESIDECSEILIKRLGFDIREILFVEDSFKNQIESRIDQVLYTQPIKFVFEYSLAKLLIKLGIAPDYMIGHSFGEIGAACLSGVFSLEDALEIVALRGELMESVDPGLMLSVNMSEELVDEYVSKHNDISLAAVNGKDLCIVSGTIKNIEEFEQKIKKDGFDSIMLKVPRAGHSNMMIPIMDKFEQRLSQMKLNEPKIPFISGLSGDWIKNEEASSSRYWSKHLKETIRFSKGISTLFKKGDSVFIQLGPDRGIVSFVEQHEEKQINDNAINLIRHKKELIDDNEFFTNQIGELWLSGVDIDWENFNEGERRQKLSLPTYEFDKHKFELKANLNEIINQVINTKNRFQRKEGINEWFYLPIWEQSPQIEKNIFEDSNYWLIFMDSLGIGNRLKRKLVDNNQNVIKVNLGEFYEKISDFEFSINQNNPSDYDSLFSELKNNNTIPHKIIYLMSVTIDLDYENIYEKINRINNLGFYGLMYIAQSIGELNIENNLTIYSVTNNMNSVLGNEFIYPEKSTILGTVKVIPLEYSNIKCRNIDIENNEIDKAAENILKETCIETANRLVAYRNNIRWSERIRPIKIDNISTERIKKNGIYLIIGGLGGVGLSISEYLGKEYQAKLILVGRSSFLDKKLWDKWLIEKGNDNETSQRILKVREIELAGGTIDILQADVVNYSQMEDVVNYLTNKYGIINGFIHAAMTVDKAGLIQNRNKIENEKIIASKIKGTINLYQIFENKNIDFMMFCSSLTGVLGNAGEVGYVASNDFIGYFASAMNNRSQTFITAIDWNGWLDVGTGIKTRKEKLRLQNINIDEVNYKELLPNYIDPKEGIEIFKIVMGNNFSRVSISTLDVEDLINDLVTQEVSLETLDGSNEIIRTELYPRPELSNQYVEPKTEIEIKIAEIWKTFFRYNKIGVNDDFFELGGDSLKGMRLFAILYKEFGVRIRVKEIFNRPNIALISEYINSNLEELVI